MTKGTVLVVDDDPVIHTLLHDLLHLLNYEVVQAWNGFEALELLDRNTPDLIILEQAMPEMDGVAFVEALRQRCLDYPLVAFAGRETVYVFAEQISAVAAIEKPFSVSHLLHILSLHGERKKRIRGFAVEG